MSHGARRSAWEVGLQTLAVVLVPCSKGTRPRQ
jgi:hypothetical protein